MTLFHLQPTYLGTNTAILTPLSVPGSALWSIFYLILSFCIVISWKLQCNSLDLFSLLFCVEALTFTLARFLVYSCGLPSTSWPAFLFFASHFRPSAMILILIVAIVVLVHFLHYLKYRECYQLDLPGPFAFPFIGNAIRFLGGSNEAILNVMTFLTSNWPTPLRFWLGPKFFVLVTRPQDVQVVLTSQHCLNRDDVYDFTRTYAGDGLIALKSEWWMLPVIVRFPKILWIKYQRITRIDC